MQATLRAVTPGPVYWFDVTSEYSPVNFDAHYVLASGEWYVQYPLSCGFVTIHSALWERVVEACKKLLPEEPLDFQI